MENTDAHLFMDNKLDNDEYKKWSSIRIVKQEKRGAYKNEYLTRKRRKKNRILGIRGRRTTPEENYVIPEKLVTIPQTPLLHRELINCIPSYEPPKKATWWDWLMCSKHVKNDVEIYDKLNEGLYSQILKPF